MYKRFNKYFFVISFSISLFSTIYAREFRNISFNLSYRVIVDDSIKKTDNPPTLEEKSKNPADTVAPDSLKKSNSIDAPIDYIAGDSIIFKMKSRVIEVYGEGNVKYKDIELSSGKIDLDLNKREVFAKAIIDTTGEKLDKPHFKQSSDEFDADSMRYNFDSKKGLAYGIITEQEDGYLHSQKTKIHENEEIHFKGGKYTTCDLDHPHFYVGMTRGKVIPKRQIVTGPAYLVIEDITTPIAIPFGFFPLRKGRSSGIVIPSFGEEKSKGFYMREGGFYFGFNDYYDLVLKGDIYSLGSWRAYMESNYRKRYRFSGNVNFALRNWIPIHLFCKNPVFKIFYFVRNYIVAFG